MGALDDLAKGSAPAKHKRQEPIVNIPSALLNLGKGALDVLQRPGEAIEHGIATHSIGNGFGALIHGETPQQHDQDRAAIRQHLGIEGWYSHLPHLAQGTIDTLLDTALDPTSYLGGAGVFKKAATVIGEHATPSIMHAFESLAQHAPAAARPMLEKVGEDAAKIHDATSGGGHNVAHMFRSLADKQGAEGVRQGKRVLAHITAQGAHQSALTQALNVYLKPLEALPKEQQILVLRRINRGQIAKLPPELQKVAQAYKTMTDARFWLNGSREVRKRLAAQGFTLPENLKSFDHGPLGVARANNYRKDYVTMPRDLTPEEAQATMRGRDLGKIKDANLKSRNARGLTSEPSIYVDAAKAANAGSARAGSRMVLRRNLTNLFGGPAKAQIQQGGGKLSPVSLQLLGQAAKQFGRTRVGQAGFKAAVPSAVREALKSDARKEPALNTLGMLQRAGDIGKGSLFVQPLPHMRNIGTLLAAMNPAAIPGALKNFADLKFGFAGPAEEYAKLGEAAQHGAIGRNYEGNPFREFIEQFGAPGKAVGKVYGASNKMLWGFDKAAKKAAYDWEKKETKDPHLAAFNVGKQLVNYENAAPVAENARFLAPFARWRFGMPIALGKSVLEHPERTLFLDRATGGAATGNDVDVPGIGKVKSINPLEEINAGAGRYARGSTSAWLRGLTYPNAGEYYLHSLPGVFQVSPPNPYNIPESKGDKALFQLTGLSKQTKKQAAPSGGSALDALMHP